MALTAKSLSKPFTVGTPRDGNSQLITLSGSQFVTTDASSSANVSPLTVSSSIITITVPDNAVQLVISNNANALRISESSAVTTYFLLPASTTGFSVDCSRMATIYLLRDSADVTVQFMFITL